MTVTKKILYVLLVISASLVGLYPTIYFFLNRQFGLLQSKPLLVLNSILWNIEFYTHISLGGLALLIGWAQFSASWRNRKPKQHRIIGKIYIVAVLLSSQASIYIGFFAEGGIIASTGFICLGIVWFYTTLSAYLNIRNGLIIQHQKMMTYSYAACLAAVTLRIYLFPLTTVLHDFIKAYQLVAWICWVPNLVVAYLLTRRQTPDNRPATS